MVFLGIDVTAELIVVDEWPEKTPAPMPTAMKDMFLPVFSSFFSSCFSLILCKYLLEKGNIYLEYAKKHKY